MLVLALNFKEKHPDLRNRRVFEVVRELQDCGTQVDVHDRWLDADVDR
jgi:UDP-N-acetyl-D-glucosamine/UDP-N-acetyl-D-galactosamine dehydrogenase